MERAPSEKERFEILLEQIRRELEVVADGYLTLDQKIDRVADELAKKLDAGFADVRSAVQTVAKQLEGHTHVRS